MQALLGLSASTDLANEQGKRPLDLCLTDTARDVITKRDGGGSAAPPARQEQDGSAAHHPT